jgi:hypothetical protein
VNRTHTSTTEINKSKRERHFGNEKYLPSNTLLSIKLHFLVDGHLAALFHINHLRGLVKLLHTFLVHIRHLEAIFQFLQLRSLLANTLNLSLALLFLHILREREREREKGKEKEGREGGGERR